MSTAATVPADLEEKIEEIVEERVAEETRDLREQLQEEREERRRLEEQVDDLEEELDGRAPVRWEGPNPADMTIEPTGDAGVPVNPYGAIAGKVDEDDVEDLERRVRQLETDGVDAADVVGLTGEDEPALPIEDVIAACRSEHRETPSSNKQRAAVVFRAFGRAERTRGGKLVLSSNDVEAILTDPDKGDMDAPVNRNTRKATMQFVAKLTSPHGDPDEWDARDGANLITLEKRNGSLALVADVDEWHEYLEEVEERVR